MPVFNGLDAAVAETAKQIGLHGVRQVSIMDELEYADDKANVVEAVKDLLKHFELDSL